MRFDILTIFPSIFDSYFNESMIKRSRAKKIADIQVHDIRKYTKDKHQKVDDRPYGGGPGMVLKIEPIVRTIGSILRISKLQTEKIFKQKKTKMILFSATGKEFTQKLAADWAKKYDQIVMVCGHYEGIDERVKKIIKDTTGIAVEEISIGPFTLTGGELPAMVVTDAILRHIPGFLGNFESLEETRDSLGLPTYTRPEVLKWKGKKYKVPPVLLTGNHAKIEEWKKKQMQKI